MTGPHTYVSAHIQTSTGIRVIRGSVATNNRKAKRKNIMSGKFHFQRRTWLQHPEQELKSEISMAKLFPMEGDDAGDPDHQKRSRSHSTL